MRARAEVDFAPLRNRNLNVSQYGAASSEQPITQENHLLRFYIDWPRCREMPTRTARLMISLVGVWAICALIYFAATGIAC
jgi:hypothetical protein